MYVEFSLNGELQVQMSLVSKNKGGHAPSGGGCLD